MEVTTYRSANAGGDIACNTLAFKFAALWDVPE
jgi:hypothetical protein